jgi:hypothetical protein
MSSENLPPKLIFEFFWIFLDFLIKNTKIILENLKLDYNNT